MTRSDIHTLRTTQLLSILAHGNPAEDVIPERAWASDELASRVGHGTHLPPTYRPGPHGSTAREFDCPLCGQHITDGKPCGCGAR